MWYGSSNQGSRISWLWVPSFLLLSIQGFFLKVCLEGFQIVKLSLRCGLGDLAVYQKKLRPHKRSFHTTDIFYFDRAPLTSTANDLSDLKSMMTINKLSSKVPWIYERCLVWGGRRQLTCQLKNSSYFLFIKGTRDFILQLSRFTSGLNIREPSCRSNNWPPQPGNFEISN